MADRRRWLVAVAVAVIAVGAVVVASRPSDESGTRIDIAAGEREAGAACRDLARFSALAHENASSDDVRDALDDADGRARRALDHDPAWVRLSSAVMALDHAVRRDDPASARTGIDIAREECARLHVAVP